ncbi:alpha/beta hydrolase family protein [Sphingomonas melonis]|uniref:Dipeptidyl aminopeptidase/acylaminoacyl peptidase n=1 Tax=Sphingomonas melonis TaxID=152682 RepID=A0A7Y9JZW1_9SPHN|nr:prolyl oligopeptidase family serine peptidase [Sphingomonas melonis]NYD89193.1 dipeptidyl aminopeptidase/acylaminoacyl peptidase [Sphingomonas melonis]
MRRMFLAALLVLASFAQGSAVARPYDMDAFLKLRSYGEVAMAPRVRLVVVERRRPYELSPDFGYGAYANRRALGEVLATSIDRPSVLRPLFAQESGAGYWMAGLSPSGLRMAVYRLRERRLSLGVVDLRSGGVRWLATHPDLPTAAPNPTWLAEDRLAYVAMKEPRLPAMLLAGTGFLDDLVGLYAAQARGGLSGTSMSSRRGAAPDRSTRRVVLEDLRSGTSRILFEGDVDDLVASEDGSRIAVVTAGAPVSPPVDPISVSFGARTHEVHIVDVASGGSVRVVGQVMRGVMSWSKDNRLLLLMREDSLDWRHGYYAVADSRGHVVRVGGKGAFAQVVEEGGGRTSHAGWAGSTPVALMAGTAGGGASWRRLLPNGSERVDVSNAAVPVGRSREALLLQDGHRVVAVDDHGQAGFADHVEQAEPLLLEPYNIGFRIAMNPERLRLLRRLRGGATDLLTFDDDLARTRQALAASRPVLAAIPGAAVTMERDAHDRQVLHLERRGNRPLELDRINDQVGDVDLPVAVKLRTTDRSGAPLTHWLLLPGGRAGSPPLVVVPYPGTTFGDDLPFEARLTSYNTSISAPMLVSAGYAVLLPSMPTGGGDARPSEDIVPQVEVAVAAARLTGLVDVARTAVIGHSFGGYAALVLATRSRQFQAIVASNGISDVAAMHGAISGLDRLRLEQGIPFPFSAGWVEGGQANMRKPPASDPGAFVEASPAYGMDRARAALLLIGGDLDPVEMSQMERAFMEAARHGGDVELLRYWGEGHELSSPGNLRHCWRATLDFLRRSLSPAQGRLAA